jgi:hypothetical protein
MKEIVKGFVLVIFGALLAVAIMVVCGAPPSTGAAVPELPPIFKVGAKVAEGPSLDATTGKIMEVSGEWIRLEVKPEYVNQYGGGSFWAFAPAREGGWQAK